MFKTVKPSIAITMGDPTGVGPEIIVKAIASGQLSEHCKPLIIGRPAILRQAAHSCSIPLEINEVESVDQWRLKSEAQQTHKSQSLWCLVTGKKEADDATDPKVDVRGGQLALDCLVRATTLALQGQVDAIVTSPLHKVALLAAGHDWPGHTELLAHLCGVKEYAMMLYLPPGRPRHGGQAGFGVVHVTLHMALREVFEHLTIANIGEKIGLANDVFKRVRKSMGLTGAPRIAVAGLAPGEAGVAHQRAAPTGGSRPLQSRVGPTARANPATGQRARPPGVGRVLQGTGAPLALCAAHAPQRRP